MLRPVDVSELERRGHVFVLSEGTGETMVVLSDMPTPPGLKPVKVDVLIRVPSLFPAVNPDMFWVAPPMTTESGALIPATQVTETFIGRQWQRWSRHLQPSQWRPDSDDLGTYVDIVHQCMRAAA
jgi:Prokaryotic E2 family E